jgi:hypothetical protein
VKGLYHYRYWLISLAILLGVILGGYFLFLHRNLPYTVLESGHIYSLYNAPEPRFLVFASSEDADTSQSGIQLQPIIKEQLRALDYSRNFAVLVLNGEIGFYLNDEVTIQQISRTGKAVTIRFEYPDSAMGKGKKSSTSSPYALIAVSKNGGWDETITFILIRNGKAVEQTAHFIP